MTQSRGAGGSLGERERGRRSAGQQQVTTTSGRLARRLIRRCSHDCISQQAVFVCNQFRERCPMASPSLAVSLLLSGCYWLFGYASVRSRAPETVCSCTLNAPQFICSNEHRSSKCSVTFNGRYELQVHEFLEKTYQLICLNVDKIRNGNTQIEVRDRERD